ncbi:MAG: flagellar assembly protein FliH [Sulfurospirillum sp.]|nr:flagellar assembly protein FliH [Sulfurospirillum sp.]
MRNVIANQHINNHTIKSYNLKALSGASNIHKSKDIKSAKDEESKIVPENEKAIPKSEPIVQIDEQQNKFIEELLKKSDELSSNIIKLQMQIEKQESDFNSRLQNEIKRESENAYEKGYQKSKEDLEVEIKELKEKYLNSINILEKEAGKKTDFLKKIERDLSTTAVEIAREVILKEVAHSSNEIAIKLSKNLIKELKDAKKIKIKVNPVDYKSLNEIYSSIENIIVDSDSSITKGGVVILSDTENLDGNISTRLEKAKNLIENE